MDKSDRDEIWKALVAVKKAEIVMDRLIEGGTKLPKELVDALHHAGDDADLAQHVMNARYSN